MKKLNYSNRRPVTQVRKLQTITVVRKRKLGRQIFGDRSISFEIVSSEIMFNFRKFYGDLISKNEFEWPCMFLTILMIHFEEDHKNSQNH